MLYGDRSAMRQMFVDAFRKRRNRAVMSPLETVVADVIDQHPEYHAMLEQGDTGRDYAVNDGQTNPFMHMAMHIAIREQVNIDRPAGVRAEWQRLSARHGTAHAAEHQMLECLADSLVAAGRTGEPPDERAYLEQLRLL